MKTMKEKPLWHSLFLLLTTPHPLNLLRLLLSFLLFFLRRLPLFPPTPSPFPPSLSTPTKPRSSDDSSIARALSQILSTVTEVPASSRKYHTIRSLAETMIHDNLREGCAALAHVNRAALSAAFGRTLAQLHMATARHVRARGGGLGLESWMWVVERAVSRMGGWSEEAEGSGIRAEKLASEVLWLAEKMVSCGAVEEAVKRWGGASGLPRLGLQAEPRLQVLLVKISAFLLKHAGEMGEGGEDIMSKRCDEQQRQRCLQQARMSARKTLLVLWLPFLCQASNGVEAPALSSTERREVEKVMEETIEMLRGEEDEQEQVLALWLHHFIVSNPSSDWPNLQPCYARWCDMARKLFLARQSPTHPL